MVTWGLVDTAWGVLNISTSLVFMAFIDWRLALIVSVTIPVIIVVAFYFKKRIIVEYRQVRKVNSKITGAYNETITGVRAVKALGREHENLEEFKGLTSEMYRAGYRAAWLSALFLPAVQIISALSVGVILWYSGRQVANVSIGGATISIGGIQAFITYVTFMLFPIQEMARPTPRCNKPSPRPNASSPCSTPSRRSSTGPTPSTPAPCAGPSSSMTSASPTKRIALCCPTSA